MLKHWGEEKGRTYMQALAAQNIQWRSGHSLLANLMSTGEFPLMAIVYPDRIEQMKSNGEPVDWVRTTDPILVNLGLLVIAAKAPNPNAAKRFCAAGIAFPLEPMWRRWFPTWIPRSCVWCRSIQRSRHPLPTTRNFRKCSA
jgi:hypothetical protein